MAWARSVLEKGQLAVLDSGQFWIWASFEMGPVLFGEVGHHQYCPNISTVYHHTVFQSTSLLLFNLYIFNISTVFNQYCLLSALNSINIMKHLNCFSITCLISISIVFQSHALLSVTIDFQSQLIFSQHSMISISIVFQSALIFRQHIYFLKSPVSV